MASKNNEHDVMIAALAALSPTDRKRVLAAVDEVVKAKDRETIIRAQRFLVKAVKQYRGLRKTAMRPGEDGLPDKQREKLLVLVIKPEYVEQHRSQLGFTR